MDKKMMQEGADAALACAKTCLETTSHCLSMGGKHAEPAHMQLMMDCSKICVTSADFMARGSQHHSAVCQICADVCEACADSCKTLEGEEMKRCAEACEKCATVCRKM